jgi:hypothetical protein
VKESGDVAAHVNVWIMGCIANASLRRKMYDPTRIMEMKELFDGSPIH